ncbi:MAG: hypothetical protein ACXV2C_06605 [Candidatus Bathyarchaeia archaeon]
MHEHLLTSIELSQLEEEPQEEEEEYEPIASTSNKRRSTINLPRSSKRLKTQNQSISKKIEALKIGTRIRVWWTEVDVPTWYVGIVTKRYPEKHIVKIMYDHEVC